MLKQIVIAKNVYLPDTWEKFEVESVCELLTQQFSEFPATARIYCGPVSSGFDVTPSTETEIERLEKLDGPFTVVVYPEGPFIPLIVAIIVAVIVAVMLKPNIPAQTNRNTQGTSPNNDLSQRTNRARPNGRIPDIFGTVRSTPDLIALPYSVYISHQQIEFCTMCVGRGEYDISDIRDGQTPLAQIDGAGLRIYGPNTSPNSGSPQLSVGASITEGLWRADRNKSVNGQVLKAPNENDVHPTLIYAYADGHLTVMTPSGLDLSTSFSAGSTVVISGSLFYVHIPGNESQGGNDDVADNLDGTYTVASVSGASLYLTSPVSVNDAWGHKTYTSPVNGQSADGGVADENPKIVGGAMTLAVAGGIDTWVGPFTCNTPSMQNFIANFVAINGMYKDDGTQQYSTSVQVEVAYWPVSATNVPTGSVVSSTIVIVGSASVRNRRAGTMRAGSNFAASRYQFKARRITPRDATFTGQVQDEVQWQDLYSMTPITQNHFGNVTMLQSMTVGTEKALAVSDRQLNMLVTRKIPAYSSGSFGAAHATNDAAEILMAICKDPFLGNRADSELDLQGMRDTVDAIKTYFGRTQAGEFCYTFDSSNMSFEETVQAVCTAIFCVAYRQGQKLKILFEKQNADSVLLFNHRNKVPNSESRTVSFGRRNDYDHIEYQYVSPTDDAIVSIYVPAQYAKPMRIESVGVRDDWQAYFHAHREWNKVQYQNVAVEFEAMQEAEMLVRTNRISVANNTRSGTQDGEVLSQNVLILGLSQKVDVAGGAHIILQGVDGSLDSIPCSAGPDDHSVTLSRAPNVTLSLDDDASVRCLYWVVKDADTRGQAFLVMERVPNDNFTSKITAINYTDAYYGNDKDFINGVPFADGRSYSGGDNPGNNE